MLTAQWHGVQATTRHEQRPPTIRLQWELNQVFAKIDDATLFLEKENPYPASTESVSADPRTNAQGSGSHQEHHFGLGVWTGK